MFGVTHTSTAKLCLQGYGVVLEVCSYLDDPDRVLFPCHCHHAMVKEALHACTVPQRLLQDLQRRTGQAHEQMQKEGKWHQSSDAGADLEELKVLLRLIQHIEAIYFPPPLLHDKTQLPLWCWRKSKSLTGRKSCAHADGLEGKAHGIL